MLVSNGTSTFAFFLYADIQWTRADSPYDKHVAQVGFDFGNLQRAYKLPDTRSDLGVTNLVHSSNTGTNGMWAFKLSYSSSIKPAKCVYGTGK